MANKEDWICSCGYPNESDVKQCEICGKSSANGSDEGNDFIFYSGNDLKKRAGRRTCLTIEDHFEITCKTK